MKKIFTLCLALLALSSMPAMAQDDDEEEIDNTLQFVDAAGNVVADGSTLTLTNVEDLGYQAQISTGLSVKNTSGDNIMTSMKVDIDSMTIGSISCCFPSVCTTSEQGGYHFVTKGGLVSGNETRDMQTEWVLDAPTSYGQSSVTFQICYDDTKLDRFGNQTAGDVLYYGPKITINFVNADPTGIDNVTSNTSINKVTAIYNLRGEQLSHMQKGLNIVRYADGTAKKIIK